MNKLKQVSICLQKEAPIMSNKKIACPEDAVQLVKERICLSDREIVCVINLKTDGTPINYSISSIGTINSSFFCIREILKSSILSNAASIILMHNHPSGSLCLSRQDISCTQNLAFVCNLMDIIFTDHIIINPKGEMYSMKEKNAELLEAKGSSLYLEPFSVAEKREQYNSTRQTRVNQLKEHFPQGATVELISMNDVHSPPPGTLGKIRLVDDMGQIHVNWQNGQSLALLFDEDDFVLLK